MNQTCNDIPIAVKKTACDDCGFDSPLLDLPIRTEVRTLVMRHDHCNEFAPVGTKFESTRTVSSTVTVTKTDCTTGAGSSVVYQASRTVTTYSGVSQADADTQAQAQAQAQANSDTAANAQIYANSVGTCA